MPAVRPDIFLVTHLVQAGGREDAPDAAHLRMEGHLSLVRPLVEEQEGVILRQGGDRVLARFSDPVRAALCAVRIQQAHRSRRQGPAPPRVRVIVFDAPQSGAPGGVGFTGSADEAIAWSRPWLLATGAGEIVLSDRVAAAWQKDGNRELTPRGYVTADGPADGHLLLWESHSHEPARAVRRRGWLFIVLIALPSLVLLAYSWLNLPPANPQLTGDTLLWGPFWLDAAPLPCPGAVVPRWRSIPDPRFTMSGLPRDARSRMVRATGHVERRGNAPAAVLDLIDALSGRHLGRSSVPCDGAPCACFAKLTEEALERPPTAPDPLVHEVCAALFARALPDAKVREAAVARCVTASAGVTEPPTDAPPGGTP
jgi:hypothetical protein